MRLKEILIGAISILFIIWINITTWGGEYFDKKCIKGRLKNSHIIAIENAGWIKEPISENDRIIARECSDFLRKLYLRGIVLKIKAENR